MTISSRELSAFSAHLRQEDRSSGTAGKYLHDCTGFALWLGDRALTPEAAAQWREHLLQKGYAPATVNSMLTLISSSHGMTLRAPFRHGQCPEMKYLRTLQKLSIHLRLPEYPIRVQISVNFHKNILIHRKRVFLNNHRCCSIAQEADCFCIPRRIKGRAEDLEAIVDKDFSGIFIQDQPQLHSRSCIFCLYPSQ